MSNNKQQTAVEQLISKIPLGIRMQLAELGVDFEQAKEMEKEQHVKSWEAGLMKFDFNEYYNETYGGDK
jgi:hypothetical protein